MEVITVPELTPVRDGHQFDEGAMAEFLTDALGEKCQSMAVSQYEGGQSNPTFRATFNGHHYVIRKKPSGDLLPSAHQVQREYRVMDALAQSDVPVPQMIALCEDDAVIGTAFYVMEWVDGRVLVDPLLAEQSAAERRVIYEDLIDVMAKMHLVDHKACGLEDFGRPGNYFARQISRWSKQYEASKTEHIPAMDELIAWLPEHIPESDETAIVHGDYRLGNCILHPTEPRIVAVLDWELSTIGHPLADLSYYCQGYHTEPEGEASLNRSNLEALGIPSEAEQVARYCKITDRGEIKHWTFYLVYNLFRSAAIIQGVYRRGLEGNASSTQALEYKDACQERAVYADQLLQKAKQEL